MTNRVLTAFLAIIFLGMQGSVHAAPDRGWEERLAAGKAIAEGEIKRSHELKLEAARIEVLARLQQLGATEVNVYNSAHASSGTTNKLFNKNNIEVA